MKKTIIIVLLITFSITLAVPQKAIAESSRCVKAIVGYTLLTGGLLAAIALMYPNTDIGEQALIGSGVGAFIGVLTCTEIARQSLQNKENLNKEWKLSKNSDFSFETQGSRHLTFLPDHEKGKTVLFCSFKVEF